MSQKTYVMDSITLALLLGYSLATTIFMAYFAEKHITLSFLPFPIFVGEIILIITGCLLLIRFISKDIPFTRAHLLVGFFYIFIIIKALYGYVVWSPLALRNAALFYYSVFAILSYYAFKSSYINTRFITLVMTVFFACILITKNISEYYYFPYLLLFFFFAENKIIYWILGVIISGIVGYTLLTLTSRGITLSALGGLLFFAAIFFIYFIKTKYKLLILIFFLIGIFSIFIRFGDKETLNVFVSAKKYVSYYKAFNEQIRRTPSYTMPEFTVRLYLSRENPDKSILQPKKHALPSYISTQTMSQANIRTVNSSSQPVALPLLTGKEANALWRIFVITDMLKEVIHDKRILGEDFGRPFRSISIELLNYKLGTATGYWVGWLEPHNSYVHMIYRLGVIAFLFFGMIVFLFIQMVVGFVRLHNIKGILLSSLILYCLVLANFEVILELPYFAIPFWSVFGITYKYFIGKKAENTAGTASQQENPSA